MNVNKRHARSGMLSALLAFALALPLAPTARAADLSGSYAWKPISIGGGGWIKGLVVHPLSSTVRYCRGDIGECYRWDNTASMWKPMDVFGGMPASVTAAPASAGGGAVAVDPSNVNVVLCAYTVTRSNDIQGTNPNLPLNVYRSTDDGQTFTAGSLNLSGEELSDESRGERLKVDPNNGNIVYINTKAHGVWRSMDGGSTWSNVIANGAPGATTNAVVTWFDKGAGTVSFGGQTVSKRIYIIMDFGPIYQSNDGGNSWTNISSSEYTSANVICSTIDQNGNLLVGDIPNYGQIAKYTRAGVWSALGTPPGGNTGIAVDPTNANRIFVAGGTILGRSLDGGATWTRLGASPNYSTTQEIQWLRPLPGVRPNGHFESCSGLVMDQSGRLWIPGGNDGALTFMPNDAVDNDANPIILTANSQGIEELVGHAVTIPPGGYPLLIAEDEGAFTILNPDTYTALHHGLNYWDPLNTPNTGLSEGQDLNYCPNQPAFVVATSDNGFYGREPIGAGQMYSSYSTDKGLTWTKFASITNGTNPCPLYCGLIAVAPRAAGHLNDPPGSDIIVRAPGDCGSGALQGITAAPFYSTDGGAHWTQTASFNGTAGATVQNRCGVNYTFLGYHCGTWTNLIHQHSLEADPLIRGTFYYQPTNLGFWKSTDNGATWVQQAGTGLPGQTHHAQLRANPNVSGDLWFVDGYEGADFHGLFHTTNGGVSFTAISGWDNCWQLALGKASGSYPAIYVYAKRTGDPNWGVFRSVDTGATWDRISNYPYNLIDIPGGMAASWDTFGLVYMSMPGNTGVYGQPSGPPPPPPAPTGLTATAGNTQIALAWNPSSGATSYSVFRGTTAGGESTTAIATGIATTSYTNTGLTNGTTYYYKVTATNTGGTSGYSNEASAIPTPQPPLAPTNLTALDGDTQVTLTWSASTGATTYNVYRSTTAGGEGTTAIVTGIAATSYTNTGLTNGTTYYYTVAGVNASGTGAQSAEASAKPSAANGNIAFASTAPVIDGTVDAVWSGATSYTMPNVTGTIPGGATNTGSWQALWDATNLYVLVSIVDSTVVANNDSVEIYVDGNNGKAGGYTPVDWQWVFVNGSSTIQEYSGGTPGGNTTGITKADGALAGGWRMEAKIPWSTIGISAFSGDVIGLDVAYNNYNVAGTRANKLFWFSTVDNDWSTPSLFGTAKLMPTAGVPAPPTGLTATPGNAQVVLGWTASGGATSYNVLRSTVSGSGYASVATGIAVTNYTNTGLTNGTTYYFVVTATNSSGTSGNSNQASAAPIAPPAAPTGLTATAGNTQVVLGWTASGGATSYNVLRSTVSGSGYASVATGVATTSYTNTGLTNGTTYFFVVTATNAGGTSGNSNQASATPSSSAPPAPTGLAATSGNTQVALTWTPSTGATSYNVLRSTVSGSGYASVATGITATTFYNTGLTNGTAYYFVAQAVSSGGTSPNSAQASATPAAAPQAQIAFATTAPTIDGNVDAIWSSAPAYAYSNLIGTLPAGANLSATWKGLWDSTNLYLLVTVMDSTLIANTSPTLGDSAEMYIDGDNNKSTTYDANDWQFVFPWNSTPVTEYSGGTQGTNTTGITYGQVNITGGYRIEQKIPWSTIGVSAVANNLVGIDFAINNSNVSGTRACKIYWNATLDNNWGNPSLFGASKLLPGIPSAPTGLTATPGNAQVVLGWTASVNATSYNVKRSTVSGSGYATVSNPTVTNYTNTGLTNGTTYYYVVTAVNTAGESANSAQASATPTTAPAAPTGLTATPGNAQVALSWTASGGATTYNALRSTVSGSGYASVATGIATTSYTNTGLTNGTTYYFVVTATNAGGTSGNSNQASATPSGSDTTQYNFESGTQNFGVSGVAGSTIASSTTRAYLGTHSLALNINAAAAGTAEISIGSPPPGAPAGAVISYHVWIPAGSTITALGPYILGGTTPFPYTGAGYPIAGLTTNAWNTVTVTVPASGSAPLGSLGLDVALSGAWTGTVYVDSINW